MLQKSYHWSTQDDGKNIAYYDSDEGYIRLSNYYKSEEEAVEALDEYLQGVQHWITSEDFTLNCVYNYEKE